ncbi:type II toxin-antitoxin system HicA family toxin [Patescibacteria group bacterium]
MPKPISLKLILKVLKRNGFALVSQKGSHAKFRKKGKEKLTVIIKKKISINKNV